MKIKIVSKKNADLFAVSAVVMIAMINVSTAIAASGWVPPSQPTGAIQDINTAVMRITNWILGFIGLIAVLAIIWGGIQYVTSTGNETQTENAKNTIQWAIMGLAVAGLAYAIVYVIVAVILKAA